MFTQSLIQAAILVYFSVPFGQSIHFDLHVGKKAVATTEEKTALIDQNFGEKCRVRSDVPAYYRKNRFCPGGGSTSSFPISTLHTKLRRSTVAVIVFRLTWRLPKRFDALLLKATPNTVTETSRVGEVIATKLNLDSQPALPQTDTKETAQLRLKIHDIGVDRGLNNRIANLTRGWLRTFQLPFAWDTGDFRITHRNESRPPIEETISFPDMPFWLTPSADDADAPSSDFQLFCWFQPLKSRISNPQSLIPHPSTTPLPWNSKPTEPRRCTKPWPWSATTWALTRPCCIPAKSSPAGSSAW